MRPPSSVTKAQIDDPYYDLAIIDTHEEADETPERVDDPDADRFLQDDVEVIREYDRASASLLQRRLKIGYARAARIIDQLEAYKQQIIAGTIVVPTEP